MSCEVKREELVRVHFESGFESLVVTVGEGDVLIDCPVEFNCTLEEGVQIFERLCDEIRKRLVSKADDSWKSRGGMGGQYKMGSSL